MKRAKVVVLGKEGSGKTSLIKALLQENSPSSPHAKSSPASSPTASMSSSSSSGTERVQVYHWDVNNDSNKDADSGGLSIDIWDLPNSMVYQEAHGLHLTTPCLFLFVLEAAGSHDELYGFLSLVHNKCPGCQVVIALTHSDQLSSSDNKELTTRTEVVLNIVRDWLDHRKLLIKRLVAEIKSFVSEALESTKDQKGKPDERTLQHRLTDQLKHAIKKGISLPETVFNVSPTNGMGIAELRQALIEKATDKDLLSQLRDETPQSEILDHVQRHIQETIDLGHVLVPWNQFCESVKRRLVPDQSKKSKKEPHLDIDSVVNKLRLSGTILDIRLPGHGMTQASSNHPDTNNSSSSTTANPITSCTSLDGNEIPEQRYICVNPEVLVQMICHCLITDEKKTFRLEASHFWPKDSGYKPPDPHALARVLEAISTKGIIREAVFPLLWQEHDLCQSQIMHSIAVLEGLGVLTSWAPVKTDCAGLAMPGYPALSPVTSYMSVLMDLIPDNRPQLNWTGKPFAGDLQVTWRQRGITTMSVSGVKQCLAAVRRAFHSCCHYSHIWSQGLLIKFDDATVCLEQWSDTLDISCRVNGDEPGQEESSVQLLWVNLIPVVKAVDEFFSCHMPGIIFKTSLILYGNVFYGTEKVLDEPEISLVKSLLRRQTDERLIIKDGIKERKIDLDLMFPCPWEESKNVWTPEDFKSLVLNKRDLVLEEHSANTSSVRRREVQKGIQPHRKSIRRKKTVEVKWKTNIVEETQEDTKPNSNAINSEEDSAVVKDQTETTDTEDSATKNVANTASPSTPSSDTTATADTTVVPDTSSTTASVNTATPSSESTTTVGALTVSSLSKEDWMKEATGLASRFVATMMAMGVAKYIATHAEFGTEGSQIVTTAEVTAARVTADAALAVHNGDLDGAARAVIDAVKAVQSAATGADTPESKTKSNSSTSKLCTIL